MSRSVHVIEAKWADLPAVGKGDCEYTRKLATITSIESERGDSTYSFSGQISYAVRDEGRRFEVRDYVIRGINLDGPDLGAVEYRNEAPWLVDVGEDRRFLLRAQLAWRDAHNPSGAMELTMRGNLLENHALAYISSSIRGTLAIGGTAPSKVLLTTPAAW